MAKSERLGTARGMGPERCRQLPGRPTLPGRLRRHLRQRERGQSPRRGTSIASEGGFALPFTIFLVTIITIMLAAAFTRTTAEVMVASNSAAEVSALALAKSGLQDYFANPPTVRPDSFGADSVRYNYPSGFAQVHPVLVYVPDDTADGFTYIVRSVGNLVNPADGSTPIATRTIAQFAQWRTAQLPAVAAFAAINGVDHLAPPPTPHTMIFDGTDLCATAPPTVAVRVPVDSDDLQPHLGLNPPDLDLRGLPSDVADELGIDWNAIVNDSVVVPDHPSPVDGDMTFPAYVMEGNYTLSNMNGSGLLIVTGDLFATGTSTWDGVVLVGGEFAPGAGSDLTVDGAFVTGLNYLIGAGASENNFSIGSITVTFRYHSCNIQQAMNRFTGFHPVANTWVDNWATY